MTATTDRSAALDASPVDVRARLAAIDADLGSLAGELVPERIPAHTLGRVIEVLGRIERRAGGARIVLSKAAADTGAWRGSKARSPQEWLAKQNGSTVAQAKSDLEASEQLAELPEARDAAVSGELSGEKTKAVAGAATADPTEEQSLVETARQGDLVDVRDKARRVQQRADERDGKAAERMHARRSLRTWIRPTGEGCGMWEIPPGMHALWLAALEPYRELAFRLARESGQRATPEGLMADAMHMLMLDTLADRDLLDVTTGASDPRNCDAPTEHSHGETSPEPEDSSVARPAETPSPVASASPPEADAPSSADTAPGSSDALARDRQATQPSPDTSRSCRRCRIGGNRKAPAQLIVHADYDALIRGYTVDGEMCDIDGLGPVPVSFARYLAQDCWLRVILTGAHDVTVIASERRYVPTALETALRARDRECVVAGCHARHHLQMDHIHEYAKGGVTALDNLALLCAYHHALKTYCGWILAGRPGAWTFEPPP